MERTQGNLFSSDLDALPKRKRKGDHGQLNLWHYQANPRVATVESEHKDDEKGEKSTLESEKQSKLF